MTASLDPGGTDTTLLNKEQLSEATSLLILLLIKVMNTYTNFLEENDPDKELPGGKGKLQEKKTFLVDILTFS